MTKEIDQEITGPEHSCPMCHDACFCRFGEADWESCDHPCESEEDVYMPNIADDFYNEYLY